MMIPVMQTKFGMPDGNCFDAALASILELDLENIPDFGKDDNWYGKFSGYMIENWGLQPIDIIISTWDKKPKGFHLINGKSPRGDYDHTIVGYKGKAVHDPYPDGNCKLETRKTYTVFIATLDDGYLHGYHKTTKISKDEINYG